MLNATSVSKGAMQICNYAYCHFCKVPYRCNASIIAGEYTAKTNSEQLEFLSLYEGICFHL